MFVQVLTAKVADADALQAQMERWEKELRPGAVGFEGSVAGTTDDGRLFVMARFESEEAAKANSDRPEQDAWWAETEKSLEDVKFQDSVEVITMGKGPSTDAGFVQVMRGQIADRAKADEMRNRMREFENTLSRHRPDVIGDITAIHADGSYTDAIYFTNEAEARANEAKEMPADVQAMFEEGMAAFAIDEYLDLKQPRLL